MDSMSTGTRPQLATLRSLLALAMLMSSETDERRILHLAATATGSLAHCRTEAVYVDGQRRSGVPGVAPVHRAQALDALVAALGPTGGPVKLAGRDWGWAYPLAGRGAPYGFLVVGASDEPDEHQQFVLRVLVQQAGVAMAGARTHAQALMSADRLQLTNEALEASVNALRRNVAIHDRLIAAAASDSGLDGIATAVHEVTGVAVAIEDRHGRLRAWAGPGAPEPYPTARADSRERLITLLQANVHPVRQRGRLYAITQPRSDLVGVISLVDPNGATGESEQMALEHATSLVATELVRLASITETELRLGRDLVDELIAGTTEGSVRNRLEALGCTLDQMQVVVLVGGGTRSQDADTFFGMVRRSARDNHLGGLLTRRDDSIVAVSPAGLDWERFRVGVTAQSPGNRCRVGVGGTCGTVAELPRSLREAQLALKLQGVAAARADKVTTFEDLGVYRVFGGGGDTEAVERLVHQWLGALLTYDDDRSAQLTMTLSAYLEAGGHHGSAARKLSVHQSTLKYRLQRIREVSGLDLSDPDTQFNLQLATRAWRTLEAMREPGDLSPRD